MNNWQLLPYCPVAWNYIISIHQQLMPDVESQRALERTSEKKIGGSPKLKLGIFGYILGFLDWIFENLFGILYREEKKTVVSSSRELDSAYNQGSKEPQLSKAWVVRNPAGSLADPNLVEWYSKWFKARDLYTYERSNRFIRRTLERLYRNRDNPRYYWIIATVLIQRLTAFRMAHINKVFPHWYYNGDSGWLLKINNKFLNLVNKWELLVVLDIEFK